ncbi:hypothetical protein [Kitasatospora purpeofusca]|uniref:hypothetical protein n=1 Tax=Kitasatospora purpeofusca TaxID=67352 RepID=UPI0038702503|nr:hypothetical protein OIP63_04070 [Kitasatospora purpeofusca]
MSTNVIAETELTADIDAPAAATEEDQTAAAVVRGNVDRFFSAANVSMMGGWTN